MTDSAKHSTLFRLTT